MYEDNYDNILNKRDGVNAEADKAESRELQEKYSFLGEKTKTVFWCEIIIVILGFISSLISDAGGNASSAYMYSEILPILIFLGGAGVICSILYCVVLIKMSKYNARLLTAAILLFVSKVFDGIEETHIVDQTSALLGILFSLFSLVVTIVQAWYFISGMRDLLLDVDPDLEDRWEKLWKIYLILIIATIVATILLYAPVIQVLAGLALVVIVIVGLGISIWRFVLIWKAAECFTGFAKYVESQD